MTIGDTDEQRPPPKTLESLIDVHNAELSVLRQLEGWLEHRAEVDRQYADGLAKDAEFLKQIMPQAGAETAKGQKTRGNSKPDWRDLPLVKLCDILAVYTQTASEGVREYLEELRHAVRSKLNTLVEEKRHLESVSESKRSVMRFELHRAREEVLKQREAYARAVEKTAASRARYEALVVKQRASKLRTAKEHYFRNVAQLHMQHNRYCVAVRTSNLFVADYTNALQPNLVIFFEECLESLMQTAKCVAERIASGFERRAAHLVTAATQLRSQLTVFMAQSPYVRAEVEQPNEYVAYLTKKCTCRSNAESFSETRFDASLLAALGNNVGLVPDELSVNELIRDRFARAQRAILERIANTEKDIDLRQRDRVAYERECAALAARVHRSSAEFASSPDENVWQEHFDEKVALFAKQRKLMNTNHELATLHVRLRRNRLVVESFETCSARFNGGVGVFPPALAPFAGELNAQVIQIELADLDDYDDEDELLGGLRRRLTDFKSRFRRQATIPPAKRPTSSVRSATQPPAPPALPAKTYAAPSVTASVAAATPYGPVPVVPRTYVPVSLAPTQSDKQSSSEEEEEQDSDEEDAPTSAPPPPPNVQAAKRAVQVMEIDEDSALVRRSKNEPTYNPSVKSHTSAIHHPPPPLPSETPAALDNLAKSAPAGKPNTYSSSHPPRVEPKADKTPANLQSEELGATDDDEWFHGVLPREEVQRLLVNDGDYLLRESRNKQTGETQLVLSVQWRGHKHFIVQGGPGAWKFEGSSFPTVRELIEVQHRSGNPVTAKSNVILRHAVLRASWQLKNDDVLLETRIGQGNFGEVYKGRYKGREVAVKKCKETMDGETRSKFLQEGTILRNYDHPNIVKLIGIAAQRNPIMIVMEFVEGGALLNYLKANKSRLKTIQLVRMCVDAAAGMSYLESKNCIHRDLAARNCLIGRDLTVKIADFGMSREEEVYEVSDGLKQIPIKWTAPEALNLAKYTSKCDVWSFGVLMWEVFAGGATPYTNMSNQAARDRIDQGYRLPAPDGTPELLYAAMRRCWLADPAQRPTFRSLLTELRALEKQLAPPGVAVSVSVTDLLAAQIQAGLSLPQVGDELQLHDDEM